MISVIVPTLNEEANICELITHIRSCEGGRGLDLIICDAPSSTDKGFITAEKMGARALRSPKAYRSYQLNYGAQHARCDLLYFLHADARPPHNFVSQITESIQDFDFGIFAYRFDSQKRILKMNSYFTKYDGLFAGGGDQSLFIKKEVFKSLGGYNVNLKIMEDFDFYKRAKKGNLKYTIIKEPLLVSARKYRNNSWLKVNLINFSIFFLYWINGSQERMIALNRRLQQ